MRENKHDLINSLSHGYREISLVGYTYYHSSFGLMTILCIQLMIFPGIRAIIYIYIYIYSFKEQDTCTYTDSSRAVNIGVQALIHYTCTYIHIYIHTYMYIYIHVHTYMNMYIHVVITYIPIFMFVNSIKIERFSIDQELSISDFHFSYSNS